MKVVITGAGYIGSSLAEYYVTLGDDVTVVSKESTQPFELDNVKYVQEDLVYSHEKLAQELKSADLCICTAANVGVLKFAYDNTLAYQNCSIDQNTLAALSEQNTPVNTVVYLSSSEVYGECKNVKETDKFGFSQNNRGSYAAEKALAEFFFSILCHRGVNVRCARLFNVVGRYSHRTGMQSRGFIMSNFVHQAQEGKPLVVYNNESRCYIDIHDVVKAIDAIAKADSDELNKFEVFNICNTRNKYTNDEVAELVKELSASSSEIVHAPVPEVAPIAFRKCNTSKLQKYFKPKVNLVSSIKSML